MKLTGWVSGLMALIGLVGAPAEAQPRVFGSFLPGARSVGDGEQATFFTTIVNGGNETATGCRPQYEPYQISDYIPNHPDYRTYELATGALGELNVPADIAPGAAQTYVVTVESSEIQSSGGGFQRDDLFMDYVCNNAYSTHNRWMHYFTRTNFNIPHADVIAIGATPSGDQVMRAAAHDRRAVMAVAAINIADADDVWVIPTWWELNNSVGPDNLIVEFCETGPDAICLFPPSSAPVRLWFETDQIRTFNVYARGRSTDGSPFMPDVIRVGLDFHRHFEGMIYDANRWSYGSGMYGRTHAALAIPPDAPPSLYGNWRMIAWPQDCPVESRSSENPIYPFAMVNFPRSFVDGREGVASLMLAPPRNEWQDRRAVCEDSDFGVVSGYKFLLALDAQSAAVPGLDFQPDYIGRVDGFGHFRLMRQADDVGVMGRIRLSGGGSEAGLTAGNFRIPRICFIQSWNPGHCPGGYQPDGPAYLEGMTLRGLRRHYENYGAVSIAHMLENSYPQVQADGSFDQVVSFHRSWGHTNVTSRDVPCRMTGRVTEPDKRPMGYLFIEFTLSFEPGTVGCNTDYPGITVMGSYRGLIIPTPQRPFQGNDWPMNFIIYAWKTDFSSFLIHRIYADPDWTPE